MNTRFKQLVIHIKFEYSRIIKFSALDIVKRMIRKLSSMFFALLLLPCSIVLYCIGIRRLCIFTDRIGHLAIEPDTLLKAQSLGLIKPKKWFMLAPKHRVANQHLMQYWKMHFSVYDSPFMCFILNSLSLWPFMRYSVSHFINNSKGTQLAYHINTLWKDRPPILTLTQQDNIWGKEQLTQLGIPKNAWFVCIHVREGGFSPVDEALHCHRNGNIDYLIPTIEEIIRRGGWVVRLGDPTMVPLKKIPQVIDYAHHPLRSERLDIVLCAQARFILGNTSGIFLVSSIFGVPSALANMIPMPTLGLCHYDLSIPKLHKMNGDYLSFKNVMASEISLYRYASLYKDNQIEVEENSAEDILALTEEMFDRLEGKFVETHDEKALHQQYISLMGPQHYSYGGCSKISVRFLQKHKKLLEFA